MPTHRRSGLGTESGPGSYFIYFERGMGLLCFVGLPIPFSGSVGGSHVGITRGCRNFHRWNCSL